MLNGAVRPARPAAAANAAAGGSSRHAPMLGARISVVGERKRVRDKAVRVHGHLRGRVCARSRMLVHCARGHSSGDAGQNCSQPFDPAPGSPLSLPSREQKNWPIDLNRTRVLWRKGGARMRLVAVWLVAGCLAWGFEGSALAQAAHGETLEPQRGAWSAEILSAGAVAGIGAAATYYVLQLPSLECESTGEPFSCASESIDSLMSMMLFESVTPLLTASAVVLAGSISGGEGRFGSTLLSTYAVGGFATLVSFIAANDYKAPAGQSGSAIGGLDARIVVPISAVGMAAGAVLGYRLFARPAKPVVWSPSVSRNAVGLSVTVPL